MKLNVRFKMKVKVILKLRLVTTPLTDYSCVEKKSLGQTLV